MLPAVTILPQDPNCILYVDFNDGRGGTARDQSKSGLDMILSGGPAWLDQRHAFEGWAETNTNAPASTFTYTPLYGHHLFFTATSGEDAATRSTTLFEFSGNRPFMMAWVFSAASPNVLAAQTSVFNWTQGANACGFSLEIAPGANKNLNFVQTGVGGPIYWGAGNGWQLRDTKPHMYGIWRNEAGNIDLYLDGEFNRNVQLGGDFNACAGGSVLAVGRAKTGAAGEFSGRFGRFQVWNKAEDRGRARAFFKAWYERETMNQ